MKVIVNAIPNEGYWIIIKLEHAFKYNYLATTSIYFIPGPLLRKEGWPNNNYLTMIICT